MQKMQQYDTDKLADVHPDEVQHMLENGWFIASDIRDDISSMKRGDIIELLEAHGITEDDCEGVKVGELRKLAIKAIFVE